MLVATCMCHRRATHTYTHTHIQTHIHIHILMVSPPPAFNKGYFRYVLAAQSGIAPFKRARVYVTPHADVCKYWTLMVLTDKLQSECEILSSKWGGVPVTSLMSKRHMLSTDTSWNKNPKLNTPVENKPPRHHSHAPLPYTILQSNMHIREFRVNWCSSCAGQDAASAAVPKL
jgi:hypothetical protein